MGRWVWWIAVGGCLRGAPVDPPPCMGEGCDSAPPAAPECGDGLVEGTEACDDGPDNGDERGCTAACALAACGDGLVREGVEACDDGNVAGADGCSPSCQPPRDADIHDIEDFVYGVGVDDEVGSALARAADLDGDGDLELPVGARRQDAAGTDAGAVYLLDGPFTGARPVSDARVELIGETEQDQVGHALWAGELDDGGADLVVASPNHAETGAVYVVYGPILASQSLASAGGKVVGKVDDAAGWSVAVGNLDDDGASDLLIGAIGNGEGGAAAGAVYVVYGPVRGERSLDSADATLVGADYGNFAGWSVASLRDATGDGLDEVLVGAATYRQDGVQVGAAHLVVEPPDGTLDLDAADATWHGEVEGDLAGSSVADAGDLDGDGLPELLITAPYNAEGGDDAGAAYAVSAAVEGRNDLRLASTKLVGLPEDTIREAAGVGDVDGDGWPDLLVGAVGVGKGVNVGRVYLVLAPAPGTLDLRDADVSWSGTSPGDATGIHVGSAGDLDGDGLVELLVSSAGDDTGATDGGLVSIVFGGGL